MYHSPKEIINLLNVMHDKAVLLERQMSDTPQEKQDKNIIDILTLDIKMMARQIAHDGEETPSYKKFDLFRVT